MTRIALYAGGGAPFNHAAILAAGNEVEFVFATDILAGALDSFGVFVMPGGGYNSMAGQIDPLGAEGCRTIADWVWSGGMYLGSCAGAYNAAITPEAFTVSCPAQKDLQLVSARVWNDGASTLGVIQSPGIGELTAVVVDPTHPVMAGMPSTFRITHYNGPLFQGGHALATVSGFTDKFTPAERFLAGSDTDVLLIDQGVAAGVANIIAEEVGDGRVVLFGSHPEFGSGLALDDIGQASSLLLNAVGWQEASDPRERAPFDGVLTSRMPIPCELVATDREGIDGVVADIAGACRDLASAAASRDVAWLRSDQAMSLFGREANEVWDAALAGIPAFAAEAAAGAHLVPDHILSFRSPRDWNVDGGFWGVAPLLEQVAELLHLASQRMALSYPAIDGYDHMRDSPYHLIAGSYLAAIGRAADAALLVRAFA